MIQEQKILAGPAGRPQVAELQGVAVGFDEAGQLLIASNNLNTLSEGERLVVAHALADLLGRLLPAIAEHVH